MRRFKVYFLFFIFWVLIFKNVFAQIDLESIKEDYFKKHLYDEFVDYLLKLERKNISLRAQISYYIALARYYQLKYLEEIQNWDLYFKYGNSYREELVKKANITKDLTSYKDKFHIYALSLLWRFYKEQQDPQEIETKKSLMETCSLYLKENTDIMPVKEIADMFLSYDNRADAEKLYKLYIEKLVILEKDPERLAIFASEALKEKKIELALFLYEAYIERITQEYPRDKLLSKLVSIIRDLSYQLRDSYSSGYIEKIFGLIESLYGKEIFDEELFYLRIKNLENTLNYQQVLPYYLDFLQRFSKGNRAFEITFKTAIVYAYSLGDLEKAVSYFNKLTENQEMNSFVLASLYQLGLINQWQGDYLKAKEYYRIILDKTDKDFEELKRLVDKRIQEIENNQPIEYNLKLFLDTSFIKERVFSGQNYINLSVSDLKVKKGKTIEVSAVGVLPESGCMPIEVSYLWSGDLGNFTFSDQKAFSTTYFSIGTKLINLVVVTPVGILDKKYIMIDVE